MNQAAHDGGGGVSYASGDHVLVDSAALTTVTTSVVDAGTTLDEAAVSMPATGGCGEAEVLVAAMLADFSDAAVATMSEGQLLADTADECNVAYLDADAEVAAHFLVDGPTE